MMNNKSNIMSKEVETRCKKLIFRYINYKSEAWKSKVRNELFEILLPHMKIWVQSILKRWGKQESEQKILSFCWDCFYFCLSKHNGSDVSVPKYFYDFSRFSLLFYYTKKSKVEVPLDEFKEIIGLVNIPQHIIIDRFLTLFKIRDVIPKKYLVAFDDAYMSICANRPADCKLSKHGMDKNVYYATKNVLKPIIELILGVE